MEQPQSTTGKEATRPVSAPSRAHRRVTSLKSRILGHRTVGRKLPPIRTPPAKRATGYSDLPPELRIKILEYALGVNLVWPYHGLTRHEIFQQDLKTVVAARRQAVKDVVLRPSNLALHQLEWTVTYNVTVRLKKHKGPYPCRIPREIGPHLLLVSQSMYDEGRKAFYAKRVFHVSYGPLSSARSYYDNLRAENQNAIRKMVLDISLLDLTYEAFESIEAQVRFAWNGYRGRSLPPNNATNWWAVATFQCLLSIWRTKLAWLRQWTQLSEVEIRFFSTIPELRRKFIQLNMLWKDSYHLSGNELSLFLRGMVPLGVGPEPYYHRFPAYQYEDCDPTFCWQMMTLEREMARKIPGLLRTFGWKAFRCFARSFMYGSRPKMNYR